MRLHHDDVASRMESMFVSGRIATCAVVDLEILRTARSPSYFEETRFERRLLPRAPVTEATMERAIDVQQELTARGQHRGVPISDLMIAAAAEQAGLTVLHYDNDFDLIAEVTEQRVEWVVPRGTVP